jgi:hypothetical protein
MVKFIPVKYSSKNYPLDIKPKIQEISAPFVTENLKIDKNIPYLSLHTDPGFPWKRDKILSSKLLAEFPTIKSNFTNYNISKLWINKAWSKEFSGFLTRLTEGIERQRIKVIEIHPPFDSYCDSLESFLDIYAVFEEEVLKEFPSTIINIENRCTPDKSRKPGKFIISTSEDIINLSDLISKKNLKLQLVIDIPQLFTAHYKDEMLTEAMIRKALAPLKKIMNYVSSTHIWGSGAPSMQVGSSTKRIGAPHSGDFNTYFDNDQTVKDCFLQEIYKLFNDGKARYFVPEVNSTDKVQSIVSDLRNVGIEFVEPN